MNYPVQARNHPRRPSMNISSQLRALGLPAFEGRKHSGIDVSESFLVHTLNIHSSSYRTLEIFLGLFPNVPAEIFV